MSFSDKTPVKDDAGRAVAAINGFFPLKSHPAVPPFQRRVIHKPTPNSNGGVIQRAKIKTGTSVSADGTNNYDVPEMDIVNVLYKKFLAFSKQDYPSTSRIEGTSNATRTNWDDEQALGEVRTLSDKPLNDFWQIVMDYKKSRGLGAVNIRTGDSEGFSSVVYNQYGKTHSGVGNTDVMVYKHPEKGDKVEEDDEKAVSDAGVSYLLAIAKFEEIRAATGWDDAGIAGNILEFYKNGQLPQRIIDKKQRQNFGYLATLMTVPESVRSVGTFPFGLIMLDNIRTGQTDSRSAFLASDEKLEEIEGREKLRTENTRIKGARRRIEAKRRAALKAAKEQKSNSDGNVGPSGSAGRGGGRGRGRGKKAVEVKDTGKDEQTVTKEKAVGRGRGRGRGKKTGEEVDVSKDVELAAKEINKVPKKYADKPDRGGLYAPAFKGSKLPLNRLETTAGRKSLALKETGQNQKKYFWNQVLKRYSEMLKAFLIAHDEMLSFDEKIEGRENAIDELIQRILTHFEIGEEITATSTTAREVGRAENNVQSDLHKFFGSGSIANPDAISLGGSTSLATFRFLAERKEREEIMLAQSFLKTQSQTYSQLGENFSKYPVVPGSPTHDYPKLNESVDSFVIKERSSRKEDTEGIYEDVPDGVEQLGQYIEQGRFVQEVRTSSLRTAKEDRKRKARNEETRNTTVESAKKVRLLPVRTRRMNLIKKIQDAVSEIAIALSSEGMSRTEIKENIAQNEVLWGYINSKLGADTEIELDDNKVNEIISLQLDILGIFEEK